MQNLQDIFADRFVFRQVMQFNILNPNSAKHRATEKNIMTCTTYPNGTLIGKLIRLYSTIRLNNNEKGYSRF